MHRVYSEENYLENIYILQLEKEEVRHKDLVEKMNRAKSVITKSIYSLVDKGLISYDDKVIKLTEEGEEIARKTYKKHMSLKKFLINAGIDENIAEKEACKIEHVISNDSFKKLKLYIKNLNNCN